MNAKRSPLAPLKRLQVVLRGTYDVIPESKRILQGTYTKNSNCKDRVHSKPVHQGAQTCKDRASAKNQAEILDPKCPSNERECEDRFMVKRSTDAHLDKARSPKTEFLKVLLGGSQLVLRNVSAESSLKDYVQAMKSTLEDCLGVEMFAALYKYLSVDVLKDLSSEIDISETLLQALGEDGIVLVPLMLQFIRCENDLLA